MNHIEVLEILKSTPEEAWTAKEIANELGWKATQYSRPVLLAIHKIQTEEYEPVIIIEDKFMYTEDDNKLLNYVETLEKSIVSIQSKILKFKTIVCADKVVKEKTNYEEDKDKLKQLLTTIKETTDLNKDIEKNRLVREYMNLLVGGDHIEILRAITRLEKQFFT